MKKILVISDSHGDNKTLKKIILKHADCDLKVHAGDSLMSEDEMSLYFDYFVSGNNDSWNKELEFFTVDNIKVCLTHSDTLSSYFGIYEKPLAKFAIKNNCQLLIHGHTHVAKDTEMDGVRIICPGSILLPRQSIHKSYCIVTINQSSINCEFFTIE